MVSLSPLATGILEGTLLALLGTILFQLRHRAGLIPYVFLLGGLALTIPFTTHLTQLELADPWTVSRAYAIVLPVLVTLVLLLHIFVGSLEATIAASLPVLGGGLVAAARTASTVIPVVLPVRFLPSIPDALGTGALVAAGALVATVLFGWWHQHAARLPPLIFFVASSLAGVLVHGVGHEALGFVGLTLPGGRWPAIAAVPLVSGVAPVAFVAVYAEVVLGDLEPVARVAPRDDDDLDERDLDRYRGAERRLREAIGWVQGSTHGADDPPPGVGRFVADPEGRILHATEPVGWMLGRARTDVLGARIDQLFTEPGRNGEDDLARLEPGPCRRRVNRPDGSQRVLEIGLVEAEEGAWRGTVRDRTQAIQEEAVERHRDRARSALDVLTRDLPNMLAAPRSQAEHLAELADDTDERLQRLAWRIHESLEDVHDALGRARLLDRLGDPPIQTLDLNAMLREVVDELPTRRLESMRIRWRTPTAPARVKASPLIEAAIEELVANAHDHAGPDVQVTIGLDRRGDRWIVSVDDDGPGVPDRLKDRIFDGFRRRDGRSSGLGLHLARSIAETFGGDVWVEDRVPGCPGEGASFRLAVPAAERRDKLASLGVERSESS